MEDLQQQRSRNIQRKGNVPAWAIPKHPITGVSKINHKPHMPCYPLCSYINRPEKMWRPHLSCSVCLQRRWHFGKLNPKQWLMARKTSNSLPTRMFLMAYAPKKGSYSSPSYDAYMIYVNTTLRFAKIRDAAVRCLMRICEWINHGFTKPEGKLRKLLLINSEASSYGSIMPQRYRAYFILYNRKDRWRDIRNRLVRPLTTLCEFIVQI